MKKVSRLVVVALLILLVFTLSGCGEKTLAEITNAKKGGGSLRCEVDEYTVLKVTFYGDEQSPNGQTECCTVKTLHYKESSASSSGKVMDKDATESVDIPCTFTENTLTLNGFDNYTYSVEQIGEREYVVFSKPFLGLTKWYIDKSY